MLGAHAGDNCTTATKTGQTRPIFCNSSTPEFFSSRQKREYLSSLKSNRNVRTASFDLPWRPSWPSCFCPCCLHYCRQRRLANHNDLKVCLSATAREVHYTRNKVIGAQATPDAHLTNKKSSSTPVNSNSCCLHSHA